MDKMERLLKHLPRPEPASDLSARIRAAVRRRHLRRLWLQRVFAWAFGFSGLYFAFPGFANFFDQLGMGGLPWLMKSLSLFSTDESTLVMSLWNGMSIWPSSVQSALIVSFWIGIILMMLGSFLGLDRRVFQPPVNFTKG
jgi:hypothetical protein